MEEFFASCVEVYKSLAPANFKLKTVSIPFRPDDNDEGQSGNPAFTEGEFIHCPWCQDSFPADLNKPPKSNNLPR
jgi:hypothetical protein